MAFLHTTSQYHSMMSMIPFKCGIFLQIVLIMSPISTVVWFWEFWFSPHNVLSCLAAGLFMVFWLTVAERPSYPRRPGTSTISFSSSWGHLPIWFAQYQTCLSHVEWSTWCRGNIQCLFCHCTDHRLYWARTKCCHMQSPRRLSSGTGLSQVCETCAEV